MHTWIEINKNQFDKNVEFFSNLVGVDRFCPVIKSNAYGHGFAEITNLLQNHNLEWIGINYYSEALKLRQLGYHKKILVVGPIYPDELDAYYDINASIFIGNFTNLDSWIHSNKKTPIHIKIDTGMGRQGFLPEEAEQVAKKLLPFKSQVEGICTHFSNVEDVLDLNYASEQLGKFEAALQIFKNHGFALIAHTASSASTLLSQNTHYNLTRVGISLFTAWPSKLTKLSYANIQHPLPEIHAILSWHCRISNVKIVPKGTFIGYGCTYQAQVNLKVAVLPVGYFEGYPRIAGDHQSYVLIHGQRCHLLGRICMNMMMVDVSHLPEVKSGDVATLIGKNQNQYISAAQLAEWSQTIHYELLTRLNPDIPRKVI